ncbi:hypothetical protein KSP39_PZI023954 [Platanthera zijinensis]|uniref:CBM20 domain-containing protein n=1 Tax=Platanthera zijinensis TaxID=2320716 RepID=A0AAP0AU74_9ASPA
MASLCHLSFSLPSPAGSLGIRSMELRGAFRPLFIGRQTSLDSSHFASTTSVAWPFIFQLIHLQRYTRISLHVGVYAGFTRFPLMSMRNGYSSIRSNGLFTVCWSIEADIGDNQLIFLTGDLVSLGCWNPDKAVLLSPSTEGANLWYAEIQVSSGNHFKYNYFLKNKKQLENDLIWRPGPTFSLSIPLENGEEDIVVRDSWMRTRLGRWPIPSWGSWMLDMDLPVGHGHHINQAIHETPSAGDQEISSYSNESLSSEKHLLVSYTSKTSMFEENDVSVSSSSLGAILLEGDQPVEEPWLLRSTVLSMVEFKELDISSKQENSYQIESSENLCCETQKTLPEEIKLAYTEKPVWTVILINSSLCTMQRIAVLENGKLVELLLEPVKDNVQCDSIYLGVVTKLAPHMGGAFVNIGISRPSFMDIKQNREPFVFPLFQQDIKKEFVNGFASTGKNKHSDINEIYQSSDDEDGIDIVTEVDHEEESLHFTHEDFEDPEADDAIDVVAVSRNMSGAGNFIGVENYSEELEINGSPLEDEVVEDHITLQAEQMNDSNFPLLMQASRKSTNSSSADDKWADVCKGTKVIVQVVKEGLGTKGPALSAYPKLKSRFWVLITRCDRIGVSKKITGIERARLRAIARTLQPPGFGLTARTVASGHSLEELQNDLDSLLTTWKSIIEHAKSAALATEEGVEGATPVMLHKAMGQTLSVVQDYFNEKVESLIIDSPRTYHEVTSYLQEIAPDLCQRVRLYDKRTPIFDEYNIEEEINNILSKRVPLSNGGSLVIEQTEALVSIDVNGGHGMLGQGTSQENAVLEVNLAAARQIARELRLRDIGGIIVVDFIDMADGSNKRLVYEEMKRAVERDHSMVKVSELSKHGLMEITRKRVRPSVAFMISEPCSFCHAIGRVEALETSFSKIEHEICRSLAAMDHKPDPENAKSWPQFVLKVDRFMCNYLTAGKRTKLAVLSSALKVWILLKVTRGFSRGTFEVKPFTDHEKENEGQRAAISRLSRPTEAAHFTPNTKLTFFPVKKWKGRLK